MQKVAKTHERQCRLALGAWLTVLGMSFGASSLALAQEGFACHPEPTDMPIGYGDLVTCEIDLVGDLDIFRFSGTTGEIIVTQAANVDNPFLTPWLELYRPGGSLFQETNDRIDALLDQTGTWTLLVRDLTNNDTGQYNLALERVSPTTTTTTPLCGSHLVSNEIDPVGDLDLFRFSGENGQTIVVQAVKVDNPFLTPWLEAYRPDGSLFQETNDRINALLDQTGTWTLLVRDLTNNDTGQYNLALERVSPCEPASDLLLSDEIFSSSVILETCGAILFEPTVTVLPPGRLGVCARDMVSIGNDFLVESGAEFFAAAPAFGVPISYGALIGSDITPVGDLDLFRFSGENGQTIVVQAVNVDNPFLTPWLELYRPDGSLFEETNDRIDALLDQAGTWTLLVRDLSNNDTGQYNLSLACIINCP